MRMTLPIAAATLFLLSGGSAFAQVGGAGVSGAYARPQGLEPHDTASEPSDRDRTINGVFNNSVDKSAAAARANSNYAVPARPSDLVAGAAVNDLRGQSLGSIEAVQSDGVVIFNGTARIKIPLDAFGRNRKGLMLDLTRKQFDQMVTEANAKP
jgi:hypothetical protein